MSQECFFAPETPEFIAVFNSLSLSLPIVLGKVLSAVGSAQLLMSQKFQQFHGLCEQNLVSLDLFLLGFGRGMDLLQQHYRNTIRYSQATVTVKAKPLQL